MNKALINDIQTAMPGLSLLQDEPLAAYCSFRIGGPAAVLAQPAGVEQLVELCRLLRQKGVEPLIMGKGSNLLITDGPLDRFVIRCGDGVAEVRAEGESIVADCGATLAHTAAVALEAGLSGLEFAAGIPGSIGGAVSMNAGAYGGEMKDVAAETQYLDPQLCLCAARGQEHDFAYRHSMFSDTGCLILRSTLSLRPGSHEEIAAKMRELAAKRRASQPLDMPSAGSTFKRPQGGYAAALIDRAGLKGFSVGGAAVSEKHAGFVVNTGGARFDDVLRLMDHIQKRVYESSGIVLEPEVKIIRG